MPTSTASAARFYFLLTGREPFTGDTILKRLMAHMERPAPSLRASRPDVPLAIEACYQKMMAKRPDDRPASMTEVIALLQASKLAWETGTERSPPSPKPQPELMVFNETPRKAVGPATTEAEPATLPRREEREGLAINHEFNLEDLAIDVRSNPPPASPLPARTLMHPLHPVGHGDFPGNLAKVAARASRPGGDWRAARGVCRLPHLPHIA